MVQNLKLFEGQYDATSRKFHARKICLMDKILYKIAFRLCLHWAPFLRCLIIQYMQIFLNLEKIQIQNHSCPKHFRMESLNLSSSFPCCRHQREDPFPGSPLSTCFPALHSQWPVTSHGRNPSCFSQFGHLLGTPRTSHFRVYKQCQITETLFSYLRFPKCLNLMNFNNVTNDN